MLLRVIGRQGLLDTSLEGELLPIFNRAGGTIAQMQLLQPAQRSGGRASHEPELLAAQHLENSTRRPAGGTPNETRRHCAALHDKRS